MLVVSWGRSPVLGGEVLAVDRHFFQRVGGFDPGMLLWGEEQIELSIRVSSTSPFPQPTQRLVSSNIDFHDPGVVMWGLHGGGSLLPCGPPGPPQLALHLPRPGFASEQQDPDRRALDGRLPEDLLPEGHARSLHQAGRS